MTFRESKVEVVRIHWDCKVAGCDGEMLPTGIVLPTVQPQYPHICDTCGRSGIGFRRFPSIEYRDVAA